MTVKVAITGPECCGKTTLTNQLAHYFDAACLAEYSREYLESLSSDYVRSDLVFMATEHLKRMDQLNEMHKMVFLDTDLLTYLLWDIIKYGTANQKLIDLWLHNLPTFYLLCTPDIDWEFDPLRENPNDRLYIYQQFVHWIEKSTVPYFIISSTGKQRIGNAKFFVKHFLSNNP